MFATNIWPTCLFVIVIYHFLQYDGITTKYTACEDAKIKTLTENNKTVLNHKNTDNRQIVIKKGYKEYTAVKKRWIQWLNF